MAYPQPLTVYALSSKRYNLQVEYSKYSWFEVPACISPKDSFIPLLPSTQHQVRSSEVCCTALPHLAHGLAVTDYSQPKLTHFFRSPRPAHTLPGLVLRSSLQSSARFPRMLRICHLISFLHECQEIALTGSLDVLIWLVWRQPSQELRMYALDFKDSMKRGNNICHSNIYMD